MITSNNAVSHLYVTGERFVGRLAVAAVVDEIACFSSNTTAFRCRVPIYGTKGYVGFATPIDDAAATTSRGITCDGTVDEGECTIAVAVAVAVAGVKIAAAEISDAATAASNAIVALAAARVVAGVGGVVIVVANAPSRSLIARDGAVDDGEIAPLIGDATTAATALAATARSDVT